MLYFNVGSYFKQAPQLLMRIPAGSKGDGGSNAKRYHSAYASISRAVRRLAKRGLVTITTEYDRSSGFNLTRPGLAIAESLVHRQLPKAPRIRLSKITSKSHPSGLMEAARKRAQIDQKRKRLKKT